MLGTMNVLRERYQFHHRQQKAFESIEQFAAEIRRLAASCHFSVLEQSLIRDHVLFGLKNKKIALQVVENGGDPSLDEIIDICSRSGKGARRAKQQTSIADEKPFEEVDVKNEPHEEDFEMLPTYADAEPDPYDAPIKSQLHKKVEDDEAAEYVATEYDAEEANYAVHSDGTDSVSSTSNKRDTKIRTTETVAVSESKAELNEEAGRSHGDMDLCINKYQRPAGHGRSKQCRQCLLIFQKTADYRYHVKNKHNEATCRFCRKEFKNLVTMDYHLKIYHPEKIKCYTAWRYECYVCHRKKESWDKLRRHFRDHFRTKKFLCPQCGYISGVRSNMERHLMREDHSATGGGNRPHKCEICGQAFIRRCSLEMHMSTHSDVRNFPCSICGKPFKNPKNLKQHTIRHGEKTHHCQLCAYSCFGVTSLNLHMKVHTGGSY